MSSEYFKVKNHIVPCQHIREYPRATANEQEDVLHLAVKQYIPKSNPYPRPGDVTIIGEHANGFPKELYEPLWDELLSRAQQHKFSIRGIWMADFAVQGQSGVLNEDLIGNDPSWNDHARDLLHMINLKRNEMPRPIIGIGHSMGGNNLVNLSLMHPRLLVTLILLDPVIQRNPPQVGPNPARLSTFRRDKWASREAAAQGFRRSKFYKAWDPRVLDRWIASGLRDMPTPLYPENSSSHGEKPVTLATTKHQEVFTFQRPNYEGSGREGRPIERKKHPDLNPDQVMPPFFYRPETISTFLRLPELRPSVLYVFGGSSEMSGPAARAEKMKTTGGGVGGSGGVEEGRVKEAVLEGVGHLVAMEAVEKCADAGSAWISSEMERWRREEEDFRTEWTTKSRLERTTVDEKWKEAVGGPLIKVKPEAQPKL